MSGTSARDAETRRRASSRVFSGHTPSSPPRAMKLKQLESLLQDVEPFREPDQMLEQYPTGAHLASRVVAEAHAHGDIEGRAVVDLGVGGGVLTIASLLMGAAKVTGLDLDPNALDLTRENCAAFDPPLEPTLAIARIPRDIARARYGAREARLSRRWSGRGPSAPSALRTGLAPTSRCSSTTPSSTSSRLATRARCPPAAVVTLQCVSLPFTGSHLLGALGSSLSWHLTFIYRKVD